VEEELDAFANETGQDLAADSPVLADKLSSYLRGKGKRVRPLLFVMAYQALANDSPGGLFRTALAFEILHDFILVHDDIVDRADLRRGRPSLNAQLDQNLPSHLPLTGSDLALIAGDVLYALGIQAFMAVDMDRKRKERALDNLIRGGVRTGLGEFNELILSTGDWEGVTKESIFAVCDLKTASYSFSCPLTCAAILAGSPQWVIDRFGAYGMYMGRAYQILDDVLDLTGEAAGTGKGSFSDIRERRKTIPLWYAVRESGLQAHSGRLLRGGLIFRGGGLSRSDRRFLRRVLSSGRVSGSRVQRFRAVLGRTGALDRALADVQHLREQAFSELTPIMVDFPNLEQVHWYCSGLIKPRDA
jgi:geranylgeranyl pyrophosphate synthase